MVASSSTRAYRFRSCRCSRKAITRRFTDHGVQPSGVNGSALVELRTNEIALSDIGVWELRSFVLSADGKGFDETTVKETPDFGDLTTRAGFNNTQTLADFANSNAAAIEAVIRGTEMPFEEGQFLEAALFGLLCASEDTKEGMNAFLEKRPANFKGR